MLQRPPTKSETARRCQPFFEGLKYTEFDSENTVEKISSIQGYIQVPPPPPPPPAPPQDPPEGQVGQVVI
jgi:hypothetical protein